MFDKELEDYMSDQNPVGKTWQDAIGFLRI